MTGELLFKENDISTSEILVEFWSIGDLSYKRTNVFLCDAICWEVSKLGWIAVPIEEWPALEKVRESATITTGLT